ncbi:ABC transporter-like protein, partial [Anaeromyces robustus]
IIGKSGCGKSTLLKLLMRFYEPQKGEILYDTLSLSEITTTKLRQAIAYVTQETYLFHDTIANNLKLARLEATQEEIEDACKKASIDDFIQKLPMKYDTKLSELGNSLSGGERQRLGLARAFLSQREIFLLDEPTSNLDSLNEAILLKSLKEQSLNKTVILVSHRRSTMAITDTLY